MTHDLTHAKASYKKEVLADVAGGFLRLAFHDAAGYDVEADDGLGPDGCFVRVLLHRQLVLCMCLTASSCFIITFPFPSFAALSSLDW